MLSFQDSVDLLRLFLAKRDDIVESIQGLLNAQRKPAEYLQDGAALSREFDDCFLKKRLKDQLEDAQWAGGFRPRDIQGIHNGPADPAELMTRAFYLWSQTRWPGRAGRVRYAHTLFNLYVIRCLELLSMRLWDEDPNKADDRLAQLQTVLDGLCSIRTRDQPVLVKDARWLIQLAQSLATDDLGAYFAVAEKVAGSFSAEDRIEIHKAGVRMAAGHLRSQIRYHCLKKGVPLNDASVILTTRDTNALDFALLVQELVPLLDAYEHACGRGDTAGRLDLADAICQGISPDPELFVNRVDLLRAYSMIEHVFIAIDRDGHATYAPTGERHLRLLDEYETRITRVVPMLSDDCPRFRPVAGSYSPYGALFGFSVDLLKHMALKATDPDADVRFGLEDVFVAGDADKLAWVSGWRKLPHLTPEIQTQFDYPQQFAEQIFDRIDHALKQRAPRQTGRLLIGSSDAPELAERYFTSSDKPLTNDWEQGALLVSYQAGTGWRALTKTVLTEVIGAGRDANISGLPAAAVGVLKLMCPRLVAVSPS